MILHKELSYELVGCCFKTRNKYGSHHREKVYYQALEEELELANLKYLSKPRIAIYSVNTGKKLTYYEPDILVEDKIIMEIKAKPFTSQDDTMQLIEYLKTSEYEVAYLINFGENNFKPKRFIHTQDNKTFLNKTRTHSWFVAIRDSWNSCTNSWLFVNTMALAQTAKINIIGCQKDQEEILEVLQNLGFTQTEDYQDQNLAKISLAENCRH